MVGVQVVGVVDMDADVVVKVGGRDAVVDIVDIDDLVDLDDLERELWKDNVAETTVLVQSVHSDKPGWATQTHTPNSWRPLYLVEEWWWWEKNQGANC